MQTAKMTKCENQLPPLHQTHLGSQACNKEIVQCKRGTTVEDYSCEKRAARLFLQENHPEIPKDTFTTSDLTNECEGVEKYRSTNSKALLGLQGFSRRVVT
jgi:hypothetical protein